MDTANTKVVGDGKINLDTGGINLKLVPRAKDFSFFSSQAPVHIQGSLKGPAFSVDTSAVITSLLTPIELGVAENASCNTLAAAARRAF